MLLTLPHHSGRDYTEGMAASLSRISVLTDIHSYYEPSMHAIETELEHGNTVVIAGDIIDGPDTKRVVEHIRSLGERVVCIAGNHEWVLRNALSKSAFAGAWYDQLWAKYHYGTMESYGVVPSDSWADNAVRLRDAMDSNGHYQWLNDLPALYENPELAVVHAGPLPHISWAQQVPQLEEISEAEEERLTSLPPQLFDINLAGMSRTPASVDSRLFVSGHLHLHAPTSARIGERRIRLASKVHQGAPLYAWRHDEQRIITYPGTTDA